jgi:hypothetical protein
MSTMSNGNRKNLEGQKALVTGATPARLGARARNIAPDHSFTRARRRLELVLRRRSRVPRRRDPRRDPHPTVAAGAVTAKRRTPYFPSAGLLCGQFQIVFRDSSAFSDCGRAGEDRRVDGRLRRVWPLQPTRSAIPTATSAIRWIIAGFWRRNDPTTPALL